MAGAIYWLNLHLYYFVIITLRNFIMKHFLFAALLSVFFYSTQATAKESNWYIKPTFGISILSNESADITDVLEQTGTANIDVSSGFNAGIGAGYFLNSNWAVELYWEYRTNDSETTLSNDLVFTDGNFASSIIATNAYYYFDSHSSWQYFLGAGLAITQEIDIDLEDANLERSFSGSGDIGLQLIGGIEYSLNDQLHIQTEVRYLNFSDIEMDAEENVTIGSFSSVNYTPVSLQVNLLYMF